MFRRKSKTDQEPPFTIKMELTEGCNLRCKFCGLQGIREVGERNYKLMTVELAEHIAKQVRDLGWKSRWEFAMHGEPTMNPNHAKIIEVIRKTLPKSHLMMTSNGGGLLRKPGPPHTVMRLMEAGLNVLALDDYEGANIVPKIREAMKDVDIPQFECPSDPLGNPYRRHPVSYHMISYITDLSKTVETRKGTIRSFMNNAAGCASPPNEKKQGKRCARPFRELAIRWDGQLPLCCVDWRGVYGCGDLRKESLATLWQSPALKAARVKLYHGERDFGPCSGCDSHSFRVGLLPDSGGQRTLPKPGKRERDVIEEVLSRPPLTEPVLRPWEGGDA